MIRHVVMFKFKPENKAENIAKTRAMLEALPQKISWIVRSETHVNSNPEDERNYDLLLISDFNTLEDLQKYIVHPAHKAVGAFMRPVRESRACTDFEIQGGQAK